MYLHPIFIVVAANLVGLVLGEDNLDIGEELKSIHTLSRQDWKMNNETANVHVGEPVEMDSSVKFTDSCNENRSRFCPKWSFCNKVGECQCPTLSERILTCDKTQKSNNMLLLLNCACVNYNKELDIFEFGWCLFNCIRRYNVVSFAYTPMPSNVYEWNSFLCGNFERSGTLCGNCDMKQNLYSRAYSFDMTCVYCHRDTTEWLEYILAAYVPLTIFCFVILLFKVNVCTTQLLGFVFYSQFITNSNISRIYFKVAQNKPVLSKVIKFLGTFFGVWNLDFFRMYYPGFCLQTGPLATLSLDFAIAIYPLVLMGLTYGLVRLHDNNFQPVVILWKPFASIFGIFRHKWDIRTSIIDSFSTFLFLSNMKFLSVCFDILVPVKVHQFKDARHVSHTWRLYYDANIPYFQGTHLYYSLLAMLVLVLFVLLPVLILLLYPFRYCQYGIRILPSRWRLLLHIFVDSFQGCYKDGTEVRTRDCRFFSAVILLFRFSLLTIYAFTLNVDFFPHSAMAFVAFGLFVIIIDPYKLHFSSYSTTLAIYMIFLSMFNLSVTYQGLITHKNALPIELMYSVSTLIATLPIFYTAGLILHWMIKIKKVNISTFFCRLSNSNEVTRPTCEC